MAIEQWKTALRRAADTVRQDKKLLALLCGAAVLLAVSVPLKGTAAQKKAPAEESAKVDTAQALEERLCALLGAIEGVGEVRVMVQLASTGSTVFAF